MLLTLNRRFLKWIEDSGEVAYSTPRYEYCIMVDQACVESCLNSALPGEDKHGVPPYDCYVYMIDAQGGSADDEGWMKMGVPWIAPRAFNLMENGNWQSSFEFPPAISHP